MWIQTLDLSSFPHRVQPVSALLKVMGVVIQDLGSRPAVLELDHGPTVGQIADIVVLILHLAHLLLLLLAAAGTLVREVAEVKHRDQRGQRPVQQSFTDKIIHSHMSKKISSDIVEKITGYFSDAWYESHYFTSYESCKNMFSRSPRAARS